MKKPKKLNLLLLIFLLFMCRCGSGESDISLFRWVPVSPEFDSINIMMDDASGNYVTVDSLWNIFEKMKMALDKEGFDSIRHKQAKARMYYWEMRIYRQSSRDDSAAKSLKKGLALMDSSLYPYDRARIDIAKGSLSTAGLIESLKGATNSCDYALATKDPYLEGLARTNLAVYYMYLGNLEEALAHSRKAEVLFRKIGKSRLADGTIVNTASILCQMGDTIEGMRQLRKLINSESCCKDTFVRISAMNVLGNVIHDVPLMREAYKEVSANSRFSRRRMNFTALLMQALCADSLYADAVKIAFDNLSLADKYVYEARLNSNSQGVWSVEYIYRFLAQYYENQGQLDSALAYYNKAWQLNQWQREAFDIVSVKRAEASAELNRQRLESQKVIDHQKFIWIRVVSIIIVGAALAFSIISYHFQRIKLRNREAEIKAVKMQLEAERRARVAAASSLMLKEKDNILGTVLEHMEGSGSADGLSGNDVRELKSVITTHYSGKTEWEEFRIRFEETNPEFRKNFIDKYPNITQRDLDFVCLIKMGMSSKHIARLTGMLPESIKKKRHRLRIKMNLTPDIDLEKVIQEIN